MSNTDPIIVTGATGFVGRHLVPALTSAGRDVVVVTRPGSNIDLLKDGTNRLRTIEDSGDVESLVSQFQEIGAKSLLHLATYYVNNAQSADIATLCEANFAFGTRIAHAFAQSGGEKFIYTSTFSQHQDNEDYNPTVLYAATKEAFADVLRYYARVGAFSVVDLELFDTFGKGDTRPKIWNLLMNAASSGVTLDTTPGEQLLCPIHVTDVVSALQRCVELPIAEGYNPYYASGPQVLRLKDAVALFEKVNDITIPIKWGAREYSGNEMFELWSYGEELPQWKPQVSLEDGFRELWNAYNEGKVQ